MEEEWKSIKGYENYKISSKGRVKSFKLNKGKLLKTGVNIHGYKKVNLCKNGKLKYKTVHQLVAVAFLNHTPCGLKLVVNHIDFDKLNNNVSNLEIVTSRENGNRKHIKSSSKYTGVSWYKPRNKWRAQIRINGKKKHLGYFKCEILASNTYQKALLALN